jgi:hypothetical protein
MVDEMRQALDDARARWGDAGEAWIDSGLAYREGDPVRVRVRKRGHRYDLNDGGAAVRKARVRDWLPLAQDVVEAYWLNVNRRGVVSVGTVYERDVAPLAARVAETSLAVYQELLEAQPD